MLPATDSAYNSSILDDIGIYPFELDLGLLTRAQLELICGNEVPIQSFEALNAILKTSLEGARFHTSFQKLDKPQNNRRGTSQPRLR